MLSWLGFSPLENNLSGELITESPIGICCICIRAHKSPWEQSLHPVCVFIPVTCPYSVYLQGAAASDHYLSVSNSNTTRYSSLNSVKDLSYSLPLHILFGIGEEEGRVYMIRWIYERKIISISRGKPWMLFLSNCSSCLVWQCQRC